MAITVNISEKEAKAGVLELIPAGWYKAVLSDGELKESKSEKNNGKPMYALEFTVAEPAEYEGRKVFTNACLWEGALYTISSLMKALGYEVNPGQLEVPELDDLMGTEVMMKVKVTPKRKDPKDSSKEYDERNDVQGFKAVGEVEANVPQQKGIATASGASLLP